MSDHPPLPAAAVAQVSPKDYAVTLDGNAVGQIRGSAAAQRVLIKMANDLQEKEKDKGLLFRTKDNGYTYELISSGFTGQSVVHVLKAAVLCRLVDPADQ